MTPVIILIRPSLGENIGAAARAMMNFGFNEMRLVEPKGNWPNHKAINTASGAESILENAKLFENTEEAVCDLQKLYATTARLRDMEKPILNPYDFAKVLRREAEENNRSGILFGREAKGLNNDDVAISDSMVMIPVNPEHRSLNIAQAILLICYEWFQAGGPETMSRVSRKGSGAASRAELIGFFEQLEHELDTCGFLFPVEKRSRMIRNIRNIYTRAGLTGQEVKTLRGIVAGLSSRRNVVN
tara:strand:- start:1263 stop:1994 length:732 start_codon:yes stop_codon:yes gene_type:complete